MIRPPPISPLFPYTPLSRSAAALLTVTSSLPVIVSQPASQTVLPGASASLSVTAPGRTRSEEHTSELQSHVNLVCRLLLEKKKNKKKRNKQQNSYNSFSYKK